MFPDVGDREPHGRTGLILWGGGHSISLPDRFAYTVHIYNFVRDFIRAFFKDFPVVGKHFLKRDSYQLCPTIKFWGEVMCPP
jgi:hypothetical protein